jgi:hypothetical protein
MTKYSIPDDHWEDDDDDTPPRWREETSADIEIDVRLHREGYQEDRKWTVHVANHFDDDRLADVVAAFAVKHQNKGNFWREGEMHKDSVDFVDLPLRVRRRVAAILDRDLETITPDERTIHREDGTGIGDRERKR